MLYTKLPHNALFIFFLLACVQGAFLFPYIVIVDGERTNIFTALLFTVILGTTILINRRIIPKHLLLICGTFITLALASGLASDYPQPALSRGLALTVSGAAGYLFSKLYLRHKRITLFAQLMTLLFAVFTFLAIYGAVIHGDMLHSLNMAGTHSLASHIVLLSFGPLYLLGEKKWNAGVMAALLMAGWGAIWLSAVKTILLLPPMLTLIAFVFGSLRKRTLTLILAFALISVYTFAIYNPQQILKLKPEKESVYYRLESYPFSWHIIQQHPILGIGLTSPRGRFVHSYEMATDFVGKEKFAISVGNTRSAENMWLTIATGMGLPFALFYFWFIAVICRRFIRVLTFQHHYATNILAPVGIPMAAILIHSLVDDSLVFPQTVWFFHLLAGLIPQAPGRTFAMHLPTSSPKR